MEVELIIISYNTRDLTLRCIETALEYGGLVELEICIVDNASSDDTISKIRSEYPKVRIIENVSNLGYAKACNIGVLSSSAEYIILSNSDVEYKQDSLKYLIESLSEPNAAFVGPQQFFPNGRHQRSSGFAPGFIQSVFDFGLDKVYRNVCWNMTQSPQYQNGYIDGAVLAFRKEVYKELEGMDEDYFFYTEEADLCYRAWKKGYRNFTVRQAEVIHLRGSSSDKMPSDKSINMLVDSKRIFLNKHRSALNRYLTQKIEMLNYGLRWWLAERGISIVPDQKKELLRILFQAWKKKSNK